MGFQKPQKGKAHAKVLVYGSAGVGKTHFALTFPKAAVVDTEGGTAFFAGRTDHGLRGNEFLVAEERSYLRIIENLEAIANGDVACDSIALDSVTSVYNVLNLALSQDGKKSLTPRDWGLLKSRFKAVLDFCYDALPKHVVLTAHEKVEYAREGDVVNGRVVGANELVTIGHLPDCDRKAEHACDFVFRVSRDGQTSVFECMKSRDPAFAEGRVYRDLTFADFAKIILGGAVRVGKTDAQAAREDAAAIGAEPEFAGGEGEKVLGPKELAAAIKTLAETLDVKPALVAVFGKAAIPPKAAREDLLRVIELLEERAPYAEQRVPAEQAVPAATEQSPAANALASETKYPAASDDGDPSGPMTDEQSKQIAALRKRKGLISIAAVKEWGALLDRVAKVKSAVGLSAAQADLVIVALEARPDVAA